MSSTQEYKEARVQYWEEMLGFEYSTNSTKFRAFTACKALCDHVDAMKVSAAYYTTDYQICHSEALQSSTVKFFDDWASELWPDHGKFPRWLHDDGVDRLRVPRDSSDLREHLWRFVETKCMSHFKHNPDQRGTLASELGSSTSAEHDQQARLWANNKRPPRPARGCKSRSNGCLPSYSYIDDYDDDDDEELVFFKQERSSETMETAQAKLARAGSAYLPRTHNTDMHSVHGTRKVRGFDGRLRKRPASGNHHMPTCAPKATFKTPQVPLDLAALASSSVSSESSPSACRLSTSTPRRGTDRALTDIQLSLYIDGHSELAGVIELTNVITRDELFAMIQHDLQDDIDVEDRFDVVRFQRTDGEAFPRPNARSVPIKRFGQQDMWKAMVKSMLEHNIGDLVGFVIVKRGVNAR